MHTPGKSSSILAAYDQDSGIVLVPDLVHLKFTDERSPDVTRGVNVNMEQTLNSAETQEAGLGPRSPDSRSQWRQPLPGKNGEDQDEAAPLEGLEEHPPDAREGRTPSHTELMSLCFSCNRFFPPISLRGDEAILKNAQHYKIKPESHSWASVEPTVENVEHKSFLYAEGAFRQETHNRRLELTQRLVCSKGICCVSRTTTPPTPYVLFHGAERRLGASWHTAPRAASGDRASPSG